MMMKNRNFARVLALCSLFLGGGVFAQQYTLNGELTVTEKTTAAGGADITGDLKLLSAPQAVDPAYRLLYLDQNGKVQPVTEDILNGLLAWTYKGTYVQGCGELTMNPNPVWSHGPGVIYVDDYLKGCYYSPNVGIGLSNPAYLLHVDGEACIESNMGVGAEPTENSALLVVNNSGESGVQIVSTGGDTSTRVLEIVVDNEVVRGIVLANAEGDVFRVNGDGEVWATGIFVELAENFPDYVFERDYKLMRIEELEAYIKDHLRLPNMPSAEEVKETGVDLGEMNRLLVEKVEELTLYIIELNKRIAVLESKQANSGK